MVLNGKRSRGSQWRRGLSRRAAIVGLVVALLGSVAPLAPASAATGYGLDGTDPGTTGCLAGSSRISSMPIRVDGTGAIVGAMDVWYSPTCGTNWVRANNATGATLTVIKTINRDPNNPPFYEYEADVVNGWSYSMQVYAPGATCVYATAVILGTDGDFYAWAGGKIC